MFVLALVVLALFTVASLAFITMIFVLDPGVYFATMTKGLGVVCALFVLGVFLLMSSCGS